jgi:acyl-CoA-binding protein
MRGLRAKKKSQQNLLATTTKQPPKWTKCYDNSSRYHYYYNNSTGDTTWEKPGDFDEDQTKEQTNVQEEKTNAQEDKTNAQEENAQEENIKEVPFDEWCEVFDPSSNQNYYQNLLDESVSQWELPEGFDPVAARKRVKLLMSCGSISELPHGLALLVACRKIQSVYRAKQARQKMRGLRAKKKSQQNLLATTTKQPPKWTKCFDKQSGYHYYYNNSTGDTSWEKPGDFEG